MGSDVKHIVLSLSSVVKISNLTLAEPMAAQSCLPSVC